MENENKVTPGKILKKIRKELGFKQHELAADDITRNLISLIENNRATLNRGNAEILVKNMNRLCKERGIDIELEFKDFFIDGIYDAKSKARSYITFLKDSTREDLEIKDEKINEISVFLSKWDLSSQNSYIYQLIAQYYTVRGKYEKSYFYYIRAFENAVNIKNDLKTLLGLTPYVLETCLKLQRNSEALEIANIALSHATDSDIGLIIPVWNKRAIINCRLSKLEDALKDVSKMEKYIDSSNMLKYIDFQILKSTVYSENKNLKKASDILSTLYEEIEKDDIENLLLVNSYLMQINLERKNKKGVDQALEIFESKMGDLEKSSPYITQIFNSAARVYISKSKIDKSAKYLHEALHYSIVFDDILAFKAIVDTSISSGDENISRILSDFILKNANELKEFIDYECFIKLMNYFYYNKQDDAAKSLVHKLSARIFL